MMLSPSQQNILQAINLAVAHGAQFFAYHMPDASEAVFGVQTAPAEDHTNGFAIHPFAVDNDCPSAFIVPQLTAEQYLSLTPARQLPILPIAEESTTQEQYLHLAEHTVSTMRSSSISKIVISRAIVKPCASINWGERFFCLANTNPKAFTFIFNHPSTGAWMGATPELLLSCTNGICHTMALAATKPSDSLREWTEKEITEQAIVRTFIEDTFKRLSLPYECSATYSRRAAGVQHLCTEFTAQCPEDKLPALTAALHPTPAISGMPKEEAIAFITENENHRRRYYGGYIGPVSDGNFHYFVNLRSMQFDAGRCCIYAGGGLTADSIPLDEWNETQLKSKLLLNLIGQQ